VHNFRWWWLLLSSSTCRENGECDCAVANYNKFCDQTHVWICHHATARWHFFSVTIRLMHGGILLSTNFQTQWAETIDCSLIYSSRSVAIRLQVQMQSAGLQITASRQGLQHSSVLVLVLVVQAVTLPTLPGISTLFFCRSVSQVWRTAARAAIKRKALWWKTAQCFV